MITREGNTLSSVIRQSWDTDRLSVMTKTPIKATEAHITIVGHITETELIRTLQETETANGFANRFNWLCVQRSKYLPDGGSLSESDLNEVVNRLHYAAQHARITKELKRDANAAKLWRKVYRPLSDGFGGLLGSVTSRATAQVMRLACLYALLDEADVIRVEHLEAALALWQYCEDSAKYIFGMSVGDRMADDICKAIEAHPDGLAKTDIHGITGRNRSARELDAALELLQQLGRIEKVIDQTPGKQGRPPEIFRTANELHEKNELTIPDGTGGGLNSFNSFNSSMERKAGGRPYAPCPDCRKHAYTDAPCPFCKKERQHPTDDEILHAPGD